MLGGLEGGQFTGDIDRDLVVLDGLLDGGGTLERLHPVVDRTRRHTESHRDIVLVDSLRQEHRGTPGSRQDRLTLCELVADGHRQGRSGLVLRHLAARSDGELRQPFLLAFLVGFAQSPDATPAVDDLDVARLDILANRDRDLDAEVLDVGDQLLRRRLLEALGVDERMSLGSFVVEPDDHQILGVEGQKLFPTLGVIGLLTVRSHGFPP